MVQVGVLFGRARRQSPSPNPCLSIDPSSQQATQPGYAAVDAMVALIILAMSVIFSLQAARQAEHAADVAREARRAQVLLMHLIETAPRSFQDGAGTSDGFAWRVETRATGAEQPIAVCRREVRLRNEQSRRAYQAATLETCPVEGAA